MKRFFLPLPYVLFLTVLISDPSAAQMKEKPGSHPFPIVEGQHVCSVLIDPEDAKVVEIAAKLFVHDVFQISGQKPEIKTQGSGQSEWLIIAGTLHQNRWIDQLVREGKVDTLAIHGKWESWIVQVMDHPFSGVAKALAIVGSDRRATAYGILELSRMMGISPWEWWADVRPVKRNKIILFVQDKVYGSPSVKYRGLFINDEDWGFQPWAAKTFEPETGNIGPKTYAKVFELMLRLRANTIWPAMHSCSQPFYFSPENKKVADDYAIVVGTSHCEPMLCNVNAEWVDTAMGEWSYDTNPETIRNFFERRVKESAAFENIYTVGMRGKHDTPMNTDGLAQKDQIRLLEKVISDQRNILQEETGRDPKTIPQAFIPYKEMLEYYQQGLKIPADITLMWTDDNYGYIRQFCTPSEQKRPGGSGIYYHVSYLGRPHDYLWLSTTDPVLIWEEMSKAYALKSRTIWILNCGDIKPAEYNIELFMDLAWDISRFPSSQTVHRHLKQWLSEKFGTGESGKLTQLMAGYYHLSFIRRPEFMAWSQTEPTTQPGQTELSQIYNGDELTKRLIKWKELAQEVKQLYSGMPSEQKDAFFELVYYPVTGASLMNQKWLYYYKSEMDASQGRSSAIDYAKMSDEAYRQIQAETNYYNNQLCNGKWKHIMSMTPCGLPVFSNPIVSIPSFSGSTQSEFGLAIEGHKMDINHQCTENTARVLPVFSTYAKDSGYVDVFLKGKGQIQWQATTKDPWIRLSSSKGILSAKDGQREQRIWVRIDWNQVPRGKNTMETPPGNDEPLIPPGYKVNSSVRFCTADTTITIGVSVYNPNFKELNDYHGFIEDKGFVSIKAENFTHCTQGVDAHWQTIDGIGYTGKVMMALPYTAESDTDIQSVLKESPELEYDFYTFNSGDARIDVQVVPTHPFYEGRGVRCAVAVDDGQPVILDFHTIGRSDEWKQNVLKNAAIKSARQLIRDQGKHQLKIWMVDPGIMIDQILIDLGGWRGSYAFPSRMPGNEK